MEEQTYAFRFYVEGDKYVEIDVSKDRFEKLSAFCDENFPDRNWKTKHLAAVEV